MLGKKPKPHTCNTQITTDPNLIPLDGIKDVSNIITEPDKTAVVDTYRVPYTTLLQFATGTPWPVTYYRRLLGANDSMELLDLSDATASQQYEKIEGLIIRVTSAIDPTQDSVTKEWNIEGGGSIGNSIVPNKHDFFTAEVGDGHIGVLNINQSEKASINKVALYEVTYSMLYELTNDMRDIIESKVVREYVYDQRRIPLAEDPLMSKDDHRKFLNVFEALRYIRATYPLEFYKRVPASIEVPTKDTTQRVYDAWLTTFARQVGCTDEYTSFNIYSHPPFTADDMRTVWWALEQQFPAGIVFKKMLKHDIRAFAAARLPGSVSWSDYTHTYFPAEQDIMPIKRFWQYNHGIMPPVPMDKSEGFVPTVTDTPLSGLGTTLPLFIPLDDELYVFSKEFYEGSYASQLEFLMYSYLNRKPISPEAILQLVEALPTIPAMERFYYTPVIVMLLECAK